VTDIYGAATATAYGHMRFATDAEISVGTETGKAVTPKQLKATVAGEASARTAADDLLAGEAANARADIHALMSMLGKRTWQEAYEKWGTWQAMSEAAGTWMRAYMKVV
jgi:hypothetical protein